ncbi:MAG: hypothetical protein AB7P21_28035 [Lautropia sp.]
MANLLLLAIVAGCGSDAGTTAGDARQPVDATVGVGASTGVGASSGAPVYPQARAYTEAPLEQPLPLPAYLSPSFYRPTGTLITRVSDAAAFGTDERVLKHEYSRRAVWNADGSKLMLALSYPAWILDASNYGSWRLHDVPSEPLWSNLDPDAIFGLTGNAFVRYSIASRSTTVLRVFDGYRQLSIGGGEGVQSDDDRYVALIGRRTGGVDVLVYDRATDAVGTLAFDRATAPNADIDWVGVSPSGRFLVVKYDFPPPGVVPGFQVYDRASLQLLRTVLPGSFSHSDMGYDAAGREVLVAAAAGSPAIVAVRLADGVVQPMLSADAIGPNVHVSCRNRLRPGWCYFGTYADPGADAAYLSRSVFGLRLDGSERVERFSPAFFADAPLDLAYERQAWAVPDPTGARVLFASDWGDPGVNARVNVFVVEAVR